MVSGNILRELNIRWLGKLPYGEAYILQKGLHAATSQESSPFDYLLLLEHNNVVTIGRSGDINNLLVSKNIDSKFSAINSVIYKQRNRSCKQRCRNIYLYP